MMDVKKLLKAWGFELLAEDFIKNGIDMEVMKICNIDELSSLLSPLNLGSKIKFRRRLEEFQKGAVWVEICSEVPIDGESSIIALCPSEIINEMPDTSSPTARIPKERNTTVPIVDKSSINASCASEIFNDTPSTSNPMARFPKASPNSSKVKLNNKSGVVESPEKVVGKSLTFVEHTCEILEKNLKKNAIGQNILSFYKRTGCLDKSHRNKLNRLIISFELAGDTKKIIQRSRYLLLREAIVKIFPSETKETWYNPSQLNGHGRTRRPRGILLHYLHNYRRNLFKSGIVTRKVKKQCERRFSTSNRDETEDESISEKLDWLSSETSIFLLTNFEKQYGENCQYLFNSWPSLKENIICFSKEKVKKDAKFKCHILENNINLDEKDKDLSTVNAILIVGIVLSRLTVFNGSRLRQWKPTKQDTIDELLLVVNSSSDLNKVINFKQTEFGKFGLGMKPTPIVVFEGTPVRCTSYVYIKGVCYTCESPIAALDLCFKTFHVLKVAYPLHANMAWHFFQQFIYKIKTDDKEHFEATSHFAKAVKLN